MTRVTETTSVLLSEHRTRVAAEPQDVFSAVVSALSSSGDESDDRVLVLNTHEPYVLHVSGYIRNVRSRVNRAMRSFKSEFDWHVKPDSVSKMLATITITPKLNKTYEIECDGGEAVFSSGPYRGRQVAWSRRTGGTCPEDGKHSVKPDIWNGAFYGWVITDKQRVAMTQSSHDHLMRQVKHRITKPTVDESLERIKEIMAMLKTRFEEAGCKVLKTEINHHLDDASMLEICYVINTETRRGMPRHHFTEVKMDFDVYIAVTGPGNRHTEMEPFGHRLYISFYYADENGGHAHYYDLCETVVPIDVDAKPYVDDFVYDVSEKIHTLITGSKRRK